MRSHLKGFKLDMDGCDVDSGGFWVSILKDVGESIWENSGNPFWKNFGFTAIAVNQRFWGILAIDPQGGLLIPKGGLFTM